MARDARAPHRLLAHPGGLLRPQPGARPPRRGMMRALLLAALLAEPAAAAEPDWAALGKDATRVTAELIRLDTSNPPGNEILAAEYLKGALEAEGIAGDILTSTGTRSSFVARLKGDGSARPLLHICHTDVVPANGAGWTVDPFAAVEKDGLLYGRGAADIKSMCGAQLVVLRELKRRNIALKRDVIFLAQADEESGEPDRHAVWLAAHHWGELDAEYGVNEGGSTLWEGGRIARLDLQCAEKRYVDLKLVARGTPGHASIPNATNPVHALSRAVARLSEWAPPFETSELAVQTVRSAAAPGPAALREAAAGLTGKDAKASAAKVAKLAPELGALLRDTCAATVFKAGYKSNVVPADAEADVNCRLLPGRDLNAFLTELRAVLAEPSVSVKYLGPPLDAIPAMPFDGPFVEALKSAAAEAAPGAPVSAFLSPWSTDAEVFRARGVKVYGIDPPLRPEDKDRAHGNDERLPVAGMEPYTRLLYLLTVKLAARD
ncbi:M20/M25/M40 family metallo-hydrolase [bacterium]|nr:MAG: M20/M25/M40 family metallo-hydrolase [bacterium]